jgi:G3E family GTPase
MKINLVGGFLGSGKTTAIANASKMLQAKGLTSSIITNDQGKYLVDSHYIQGIDIPTLEVTGGCFCCNYDQLDLSIDRLKEQANPKIIFAESVGSCTDLVATVLKPLLKFREDVDQVTFSTMVDSRLFINYLKKEPLPFGADTPISGKSNSKNLKSLL